MRIIGWARRRVKVLAVGLGVGVAMLVATVGWLAWTQHEQSGVAEARAGATEAARRGLVAALSYDYRTIEETVTAASRGLTGEFRSDYRTLMREVVAPSAKSQKLVTKASVAGTAVVSASPSAVEVLAFVDQTTGGKGSSSPRLGSSRVLVRVSNVDGRWLISNLRPL